MNVYEIARKVNDRLNDGNESKFPVTLLVVGEILYVMKPINYFGFIKHCINKRCYDDVIRDVIKDYNRNYDETNHFKAMIEMQNESRIVINNFKEMDKKIKKTLIIGTLKLSLIIGGIAYLIRRR